MGKNRDNFSEKTIQVIAARVGYKCSFPGCKEETTGPHTSPDKRTLLGEAAHITAASPGGPRYDSNMTPEERKSADNGIWLCKKHARLIDMDADKYPVSKLKEWKEQAEKQQNERLNNLVEHNNQNNKILRKINTKLNNVNDMYTYFKSYYDKNFSHCYNYMEVNNLIYLHWQNLYNDLKDNIGVLDNLKYELMTMVNEYSYDIPMKLENKINEYFKLTEFVYQSDGDVGIFNTYYGNFFEMINTSYKEMNILKGEIDSLIREELNK